MRIGVIGPEGPDEFADNIVYCLKQMGVQAEALGSVLPRSRNKLLRLASRRLMMQSADTESLFQRRVARRVLHSECDVVINVDQSLMPSTVARMKLAGCKVALWYPDHIANISRMAMIGAEYDALFLKDPTFVDRLASVYGLKAIYLPEACNPDWHVPVGSPGISRYIAVVGNLYPSRVRLLTRLSEDRIPLKLFGSSIPRWLDTSGLSGIPRGPYVTRLEKSRTFREASGVLNNLHPAEMNSVNCRLFEATAAGGAVLCEYRDSLGALYRTGSEVLTFSSFDQLRVHCHTLLDDPGKTQRIGDAASRRARTDHTYGKRLGVLLEHLC